jgi:hypothetical protein
MKRVADGVADDGGGVRLGALAAVLALLDQLFLALSQAPPELVRNTAISTPAAMRPAR